MATGGGRGGGNSTERRNSGDKVYSRKSSIGPRTNKPSANFQSQELNFVQEVPDDSFSLSRFQSDENLGLPLNAKKVISINVAFRSKKEKHDLRRKLQNELRLVRNWVRKIERNVSKKYPVNDGALHGGKLKRVHSEVGSIGGPESRPLEPISMPAMEHSLGAVSDNMDKEKRTPKANQFYQNSDFVSGKERNLPPSDQNKKLKAKGNKEGAELGGSGFEMGNSGSKVFKSCKALLDKLMKHKHGWVFNTPVDVEGLGLHDYYSIIKQPMDLGTIKSKLNSNHYQTPRDFAEDVRLTFHNALTYNPEGHDVNEFAKLLLKIFEDRWAIITADYSREVKASAADHDAGLPTPTSKIAAPPPPPPVAQAPADLMTTVDRSELMTNPRPPTPVYLATTLDKSESMTNPGVSKAKNTNTSASGRTSHPKKPRAKDPDKRDMTFEEKQKLSASLQSLPSEKLGNVVQIIKKRNPSLCQSDDEIEVDIDSVDIETLWELDRFVVNYKKHVSKIRRTAEMTQATVGTESNLLVNQEATQLIEPPKENISGERGAPPSTPIHGEAGDDLSNGSSSSTNGSRSSSSDSDSDSSSS